MLEWIRNALKQRRPITVLVLAIALLAARVAGVGLFVGGGPGPHEYETVRGTTVTLYGRGLYRHMSLEVAQQGIAVQVQGRG